MDCEILVIRHITAYIGTDPDPYIMELPPLRTKLSFQSYPNLSGGFLFDKSMTSFTEYDLIVNNNWINNLFANKFNKWLDILIELYELEEETIHRLTLNNFFMFSKFSALEQ